MTPSRDITAETAAYARLQVRAGLLDADALRADVRRVVAEDLAPPDPDQVTGELIEAASRELVEVEKDWPASTDYDRLQAVFDDMATAGIVVLQAVDDHWSAKAELERRDEAGERVPGIAWFTPADVWHAVDHGMLEVNLWHGDSANVAPGDALLDDVLAAFERHALAAHFDEGRIEVTAHWQRRSER